MFFLFILSTKPCSSLCILLLPITRSADPLPCPPALPVTFRQKLQSVRVEEGQHATLQCETSRPGVPVEWSQGGFLLQHGEKFLIKQRGTLQELILRDAVPEDSGVYACVCRELRTKATVKVVGRSG